MPATKTDPSTPPAVRALDTFPEYHSLHSRVDELRERKAALERRAADLDRTLTNTTLQIRDRAADLLAAPSLADAAPFSVEDVRAEKAKAGGEIALVSEAITQGTARLQKMAGDLAAAASEEFRSWLARVNAAARQAAETLAQCAGMLTAATASAKAQGKSGIPPALLLGAEPASFTLAPNMPPASLAQLALTAERLLAAEKAKSAAA